MADAPRSALPFLVLLVLTFTFAAFVISFVVTLNWLLLGATIPVGAGLAWAAQKVLA